MWRYENKAVIMVPPVRPGERRVVDKSIDPAQPLCVSLFVCEVKRGLVRRGGSIRAKSFSTAGHPLPVGSGAPHLHSALGQ